MSNKYKPHLQILPEDDANREMANGFLLDERVQERRIQILRPAGGWLKALESITSCGLERYPERRLLLLIDFDDDIARRLLLVRSEIPNELVSRVYVLGTANEPERLKTALNLSLENIGHNAARDCAENSGVFWSHSLLEHNREELARLNADVYNFVMEE